MENSKKINEQNVDHSDKTNKQITKFSVLTKTKQSQKEGIQTHRQKMTLELTRGSESDYPRERREERVG